jgi:hypothetical protein
MALNYLVSRCLHVAAELGIADLLKDGPKSTEELARATGAHQLSLNRLLRTPAGHGVFATRAAIFTAWEGRSGSSDRATRPRSH